MLQSLPTSLPILSKFHTNLSALSNSIFSLSRKLLTALFQHQKQLPTAFSLCCHQHFSFFNDTGLSTTEAYLFTNPLYLYSASYETKLLKLTCKPYSSSNTPDGKQYPKSFASARWLVDSGMYGKHLSGFGTLFVRTKMPVCIFEKTRNFAEIRHFSQKFGKLPNGEKTTKNVFAYFRFRENFPENLANFRVMQIFSQKVPFCSNPKETSACLFSRLFFLYLFRAFLLLI